MCITWRENAGYHIYKKVFVCTAASILKIDIDHTKAIDTGASYPLFVCICVWFFWFFFCLSKISEGWTPPPLTKIPGSAPVRDFS